jgi:serine/threonine protein kinase
MASGRQLRGRWGHLPLPLVQLWQGSLCAKSAAERFFFARQLWETTATLLSHVVLADWQWRRTQLTAAPSSGVPSLLDWVADKARFQDHCPPSVRAWSWLRLLLPTLCSVGDTVAVRLRDWLYAENPRLENDDATALLPMLGLANNTAAPRCLADWLEAFLFASPHLTELENVHPSRLEEWDRHVHALLSAWRQLFQSGTFFREHRLIFLNHAERQADGSYRLNRLELSGESPRVLPACQFAAGEQEWPAGCVYLEFPRNWPGTVSGNATPTPDPGWPALNLHPWITFQPETQEVFFLQAWADVSQNSSSATVSTPNSAFVCPVSGRVLQPVGWMQAARQRMEQLARDPITAEYVRQWNSAAPTRPGEGPAATIFPTQESAGFELLSEVASGPQAVGYRAWQLSLRRPVRLQCLLPLDNRQPLAEQELCTLSTLSRLHHPHLIKVYEHGVSDKVTYIATEFVAGVSLASVLEQLQLNQRQSWPSLEDWYQAIRLAWQEESRRERPLCILHTYERRLARYLMPPLTDTAHLASAGTHAYVREVLRLFITLGESLYTLHQAGAVHGSIVPGRILLASEANRPILLEPGSFHDLAGQNGLTHSWRYLSPEKRSGAARLDPQADIYSLAAILAELLMLAPETLVHEEARKARLQQLRLPALERLADYLATCLSTSAEERPASVLEFVEVLRECLLQIEKSSNGRSAAKPAREQVSSSTAEPVSSVHDSPPVPQRNAQVSSPVPASTLPSPGRTRTGTYLLTILASCVAIALLLGGVFLALSWWLDIEPSKLLALLSERTVALIKESWSEPVGEDTSSLSATPSTSPDDSRPATSPDGSRPATDLDHEQPSAPGSSAPTSSATVSAQQVPELILPPVPAPEKSEAKVTDNAGVPEADRNQELIKRLEQQLQQAQELALRHQDAYESAKQELLILQKQLQSALEAQKLAREEAAAVTLKLETLHAEYQAALKSLHNNIEQTVTRLAQLAERLAGEEIRYSYIRRVRRPMMLGLRDVVSETIKFLEQKKDTSMLSLATAYLALGRLHQDCEGAADAEKAYQHAFTLLNQASEEFRKHPEYRPLLYKVHSATGRFYLEQKKYQEAEAAWLQALTLAQTLAGSDSSNMTWQLQVVKCHIQLGHVYRHWRQLDKAEAAYDNAVRSLEKLAGQRSEEPAYALQLASAYQGLAYIAELRDQVESADRHYQQAIAVLERILQRQPENQECALQLAIVVHDRAVLFRDAGQVKEALPLFDRSLDLAGSLHQSRPESLEVSLLLRDIYADRAHAYMTAGRYAEALRDWEEARAYDSEHLPSVRAYRAICLARLGEIEHAVAEAEKLSSAKTKTGSLLYNLACIHAVLAEVVTKKSSAQNAEQLKLAEQYARRAVEFLQQAAEQGYFQSAVRREYLHRDPDLEAVRHREDFKRLLEKIGLRE